MEERKINISLLSFQPAKTHLFWFECVAAHGDEEESTSRPRLWEMSCCYLLAPTVLNKRKCCGKQQHIHLHLLLDPMPYECVMFFDALCSQLHSKCEDFILFYNKSDFCFVRVTHDVLQNRDPSAAVHFPFFLSFFIFFVALPCKVAL